MEFIIVSLFTSAISFCKAEREDALPVEVLAYSVRASEASTELTTPLLSMSPQAAVEVVEEIEVEVVVGIVVEEIEVEVVVGIVVEEVVVS